MVIRKRESERERERGGREGRGEKKRREGYEGERAIGCIILLRSWILEQGTYGKNL